MVSEQEINKRPQMKVSQIHTLELLIESISNLINLYKANKNQNQKSYHPKNFSVESIPTTEDPSLLAAQLKIESKKTPETTEADAKVSSSENAAVDEQKKAAKDENKEKAAVAATAAEAAAAEAAAVAAEQRRRRKKCGGIAPPLHHLSSGGGASNPPTSSTIPTNTIMASIATTKNWTEGKVRVPTASGGGTGDQGGSRIPAKEVAEFEREAATVEWRRRGGGLNSHLILQKNPTSSVLSQKEPHSKNTSQIPPDKLYISQ